MQKFNLGEIVNFENGKPAQINVIWSGETYYKSKPTKLKEWAMSTKFSEEALKEFPVYNLEYPRPVPQIPYKDFLARYELEDTYNVRMLYESTVDKYVGCNVPEPLLEFVADSHKDWLDSFETAGDAEAFLLTYGEGF